jgi:hypothetical protein
MSQESRQNPLFCLDYWLLIIGAITKLKYLLINQLQQLSLSEKL